MRHLAVRFRNTAFVVLSLLPGLSRADISVPQKPWKEVYDLIRANLRLSTESELNQAAVEQLLAKHPNRILWETNSASAVPAAAFEGPPATGRVFDQGIGYMRVVRVDSLLYESIQSEWSRAVNTNKLKGMILDLRYADGSDYEASVRAARVFVAGEQPLLTLGGKPLTVTGQKEFKPLYEIPLVVLINGGTRGAAEALAAILRQERASVVLGSDTAGSAGIYQQFTLSNGDRLRLLTGDIKTAGGNNLAGVQIRPDIEVGVNSQEERRLWEDPYSKPATDPVLDKPRKSLSSKALVKPAPKLNEATLVKRQREDQSHPIAVDSDSERTAAIEKPKPPELRDPTLARALDVLQAIAILGVQSVSLE